MMTLITSSLVLILLTSARGLADDLPTLYEYYTAEGINTGLDASQPNFTLNGHEIFVYSGAVHYFRVPRQYWRDRLRKVRASGLNTVETYISWNLHEIHNGTFDFGEGGTEMEDFLHLEEFLQIVQEEDLFAIVRPGPYICAEWDNGGLPSWLLREPDILFRSSEEKYMNYVTRYFNVLLPKLAPFQFTRGGPIIALQVENEYGNMCCDGFQPDKVYIEKLRQLYIDNNITELLVTSDGYPQGQTGTLPGVLFQTVNFGSDPQTALDELKKMQPGQPIMVMEFWPGAVDWIGYTHATTSAESFRDIYETVLTYPASGNMYMFHGGTNWGWNNGASDDSLPTNKGFSPATTSYDYDAPLSEAGDYREKYEITAELLEKYNPVKTKLPERPPLTDKVAYSSVEVENYLSLYDVINNNVGLGIASNKPVAVELLPINNNSGQPFGYTVYRTKNLDLPPNATLEIKGHICDDVLILVNGQLINNHPLQSLSDLDNFGYWRTENSTIIINHANQILENATLDLVVENWGRVNIGLPIRWKQFKGLWQGGIFLNEKEIANWTIIPLEFKKAWTQNLSNWSQTINTTPGLFRGVLNLTEEPTADTFIDIGNWNRGVIIVNGFVLGRHAALGPQLALYLPAPLLRKGANEIIIFEHFHADVKIQFLDRPSFI